LERVPANGLVPVTAADPSNTEYSYLQTQRLLTKSEFIWHAD